jgi:hypothetical protein
LPLEYQSLDQVLQPSTYSRVARYEVVDFV